MKGGSLPSLPKNVCNFLFFTPSSSKTVTGVKQGEGFGVDSMEEGKERAATGLLGNAGMKILGHRDKQCEILFRKRYEWREIARVGGKGQDKRWRGINEIETFAKPG